MAKHTLKTDLSISGIRNLQKELEKYKQDLVKKCRLLAEKLAEKGVDIAKMEIKSFNAEFTGELYNSIHGKLGESNPGKTIFYIVADSSHAVFVEFGTLGSMGGKKEYPYPLPPGIQWNYGSGSHIIQNSKGQYGWFYKGKDGKIYWCEGMDSRPFMYLTSLELQKELVKIAKEIFGA